MEREKGGGGGKGGLQDLEQNKYNSSNIWMKTDPTFTISSVTIMSDDKLVIEIKSFLFMR